MRRDQTFEVLRGPVGTMLVGNGNQVDIMGPDLRTLQTIKCPNEKTRCALFVPPLSTADSDFAICSLTTFVEDCSFYKGLPAIQISDQVPRVAVENGVARSPYPRPTLPLGIQASWSSRSAWKVNQSEIWYFDKYGVLTSLGSNGSTGPVSAEQWTPKESNCAGDLSVPNRAAF